jgi:ABC-type transport system involved in cytochrome bd biosynthesis fused ATPase/permease subunit
MAWTRKRSKAALQALWGYGQPFKKFLTQGCFATVGVVLFRLAMPWPLRGFVELVAPATNGQERGVIDLLPAWGEAAIWLAVFYVLATIGVGWFEMVQRVAMKKFSAHTTHDMRKHALRSLVGNAEERHRERSAELMSRLIGDVARVKAEVSGILVHVTQNGLLFVGVCVLFMFLSPKLSLFFLVGGVLAVIIGYRAMIPVAASAWKQRKKESALAMMIHDALDRQEVTEESERYNESSAGATVRITHLIALSSLQIHVTLAVVTALALLVAVHDVRAGQLTHGEMFLFIAYALTVHRRVVQVGRQLARGGKALAHVDRVLRLTDADKRKDKDIPLDFSMQLRKIRLDATRPTEKRPRLHNIKIEVFAGSRVAVLGEAGSGKSSLLQVMAGQVAASEGVLRWDGEEVEAPEYLSASVTYLAQAPTFSSMPVWQQLNLENANAPTGEVEEWLRLMGVWKLVELLPQGWKTVLRTGDLTPVQARSLGLGGLLQSERHTFILDAPLEGMATKQAKKRLREVLQRFDGKTLMVSMDEPVCVGEFDHVLVLSKGKVIFNGAPKKWKRWRAANLRALTTAASEEAVAKS